MLTARADAPESARSRPATPSVPPPRLYAYVVDHDHGFAPNPFFGVCTLATCKPRIRASARVGDYVVGTSGARRGRRGDLVYFMCVEEATTYDAYWVDSRFRDKRPSLRGSRERAFGDNVYHRDSATGAWRQANSFHSLADGSANARNVERDTSSDRVLISRDFAYWGGSGPQIPGRFRNYGVEGSRGVRDVCGGRGHLVNFAEGFVPEFVAWLRGLGARGYVGRPREWTLARRRRGTSGSPAD